MSNDVLRHLASTIRTRRLEGSDTSYTNQLLEAGPEKCARKFGEEAVEVVIAGIAQSPQSLKAEAADVLYHLLVLLEARGVAFDDVLAELERRSGTSGLAEKAARAQRG
ncbi:MAG: phosphoribosyl-ATP diphosphatase [Hyphomicrobiaceae bacterium]|nr:phosphoribosyl-ATP diphosphatase [Hyphomicrobiaceae bacterium]